MSDTTEDVIIDNATKENATDAEQVIHTPSTIKKLVEDQLAHLETTDFENVDVEQLCAHLQTTWIRDNDELEHVLDILEVSDVVAFDTEFHKRDTYYPTLALIQINTGNEIYLLDALSLDLSEFWHVMSEIPVIIWHACGEDLGIFYLLSELPNLNNVFDTQIAMAFLTDKMQVGYQKSVADMLGITIDKEQSQSNWLARPLTEAQEVYAANDVKYLLPLYHALTQKLLSKNLFEYVWADCQLHAHRLYKHYLTEDEDQYLSALSSRHSGLQREFLRELLTWREGLARAINQPKTFIVKKQGVSELVELMPTSMRKLKNETTLHRTVIDNYGSDILAIVNKAQQADSTQYPPAKIASYRSEDKIVQKAVNQCIKDFSDKTGVPKNVVIKKKWLAEVYEAVALDRSYKDLSAGLTGWRGDWVKNDLMPMLQKHRQALREGMNIDEDK